MDRNICIRCGGAFDEAHYQKRGCTLGTDMKMDLTDMLHLWKEWGGAVHKKRAGFRRGESKWAPDNQARRLTGALATKSRPQHDSSDSDSPVERPDQGKKRQSLAEVDGLPFKKHASQSHGRCDDSHGRGEEPSLSADAISTEAVGEMMVGEIFFNTCMAEKMSASDS